MQFIDKVNEALDEINPRYDLTYSKIREISNSTKDKTEGIALGFRYGYLQGMKAAAAKLKEKPDHEPKYKNELRQAISHHVYHTKNIFMLRYLLQIADIFRRRYDDEEYKTVTEPEWLQSSLICEVLWCKDEQTLKAFKALITGMNKRKARA